MRLLVIVCEREESESLGEKESVRVRVERVCQCERV